MFRLHFVGSRRSRLALRIVGIMGIALLLALGSFFSGTRPALASGSGAVEYIHTSTSANTSGDYTLLDNSVTNNNPNAVVLVTAVWNPGGTYTNFDNHQVGVWYDSWAGKWGVFNEDQASMPVGVSFTVYAAPGSANSGGWIAVQTTTTANTGGYITYINDPQLNGNASASLLVTQNWNPGGSGGTYNSHAIGVWYDSSVGEWTIYNEDLSAIPTGASFNILVTTGVTYALTQVATSSNIYGDSTCINSPAWNGNPYANVLITHVYSGYFTDVSAVWYYASLGEWCVFDGSYNAMPAGATFFVDFN